MEQLQNWQLKQTVQVWPFTGTQNHTSMKNQPGSPKLDNDHNYCCKTMTRNKNTSNGKTA